MGLGIWFSEDLAHILRGVGESVNLLVAHRGLHNAADAAYMAGYRAALRAIATSLGLSAPVVADWSGTANPDISELAVAIWKEEV